MGGSEADNRILESALAAAGQSDLLVVTAKEALAPLAGRRFDVLLIDIGERDDETAALRTMIAPDGLIRSRASVIVTGPGTAMVRLQNWLRIGAEDYLFTPFDPTTPLLLVRRVQLSLQRRTLADATMRAPSVAREPSTGTQPPLPDDVTTSFLPREFLQHLGRSSLADVRLGDHVQRDMTILFSDIRDFTALSEQLTPKQNFDFLNSYLRNVNPIIRTHGGFIDKYIGDAIMALFPGNGHDGVRAALELQLAVVAYNDGRRRAGYAPIRIGIGVHRGDLILGTIGEEQRMETTVISDAVNVASRIESLTKVFEVALLVSKSVVDQMPKGHAVRMRHLGAVKAKGKARSVDIYECYDNDSPELREHKEQTAGLFSEGITEFRRGLYLSAGRTFARVAQKEARDTVAAFFRDRCTMNVMHPKDSDIWDVAEKIELG